MSSIPDPTIGDVVYVMGRPIIWTKEHRSPSELQILRFDGDDAADEIVKILRIPLDSDCITELHRIITTYPSEYTPQEISTCHTFITSRTQRILDWARIKHGQDTYLRYMMPISHILFYSSLVGGVVTTGINEVLKSTGYLTPSHMKKSTKSPHTQAAQSAATSSLTHDQAQSAVAAAGTCPMTGAMGSCPFSGSTLMPSSPRDLRHTMRRLLETVQYIFSVVIHDLQHPSAAHDVSMRVRLLHARVRVMLAKQGKHQAINQEDLLVTLLSFSVNILFSLDRLGFTLTSTEQDNLCYLWGYLGSLMGIADEHLIPFYTSYQSAYRLGESITYHLLYNIAPSTECRTMAQHLLQSQAVHHPMTLPWDLSGYHFHGYRARYLAIAPDLPDYLGFPQFPSLLDSSISYHIRLQYLLSMSLFHLEMMIATCTIHITYLPYIGPHLIKRMGSMFTHFINTQYERLSGKQLKQSFVFGMTHAPGVYQDGHEDGDGAEIKTSDASIRGMSWSRMLVFLVLLIIFISVLV